MKKIYFKSLLEAKDFIRFLRLTESKYINWCFVIEEINNKYAITLL